MSPKCYLFFIISAALLLPAYSKDERIDCLVPSIFEVDVEGNKKIFIYDAEIYVKFNRNELAVYEYSDTDRVNILINNSAVLFTGHILQNEEFDPNSLKTSRVLSTKIAGSAQLMRNVHSSDAVTDCSVYLARHHKNNDWDLPKNMQIEILHQAATCLRTAICKKLGNINLNDLRNAANHPYDFGQLSVLSRRSNANDDLESDGTSVASEKFDEEKLPELMSSIDQLESNNIDKDGLQSTINMIVDIVIAEIVKEMKKENNGTLKILDIHQRFSYNAVVKLSGEFDATDGYFSDITTLSRIGDATLKHEGDEFVASCGFGLSKAKIHYNKYELIYGLKVTGKIWADVRGVAVYTTVSIDYGKKPCQVRLQDIQVTKLGKINIKITGMGPLNGLTSKLVTWITEKWKNEIVGEVENHVRIFIEDYMSKLDCEKFRP